MKRVGTCPFLKLFVSIWTSILLSTLSFQRSWIFKDSVDFNKLQTNKISIFLWTNRKRIFLKFYLSTYFSLFGISLKYSNFRFLRFAIIPNDFSIFLYNISAVLQSNFCHIFAIPMHTDFCLFFRKMHLRETWKRQNAGYENRLGLYNGQNITITRC